MTEGFVHLYPRFPVDKSGKLIVIVVETVIKTVIKSLHAGLFGIVINFVVAHI